MLHGETANVPHILLNTLKGWLREARIYAGVCVVHYTNEFWRKMIWCDEKTLTTDGYSP